VPEEQLARLDWLGDWMAGHAPAVVATRPWITPGTTTAEGTPVRFTARDDTVHALLLDADWKQQKIHPDHCRGDARRHAVP
jgi:alpha-L-fucosidase